MKVCEQWCQGWGDLQGHASGLGRAALTCERPEEQAENLEDSIRARLGCDKH